MSKPTDWILPRIREMTGYVPGAQPERPDVIKLNTNENPFPAPARVRAAIERELDRALLQRYPNPKAEGLRAALGKKHGQPPTAILAGNGSDEILAIVFRALLESGRRVVFSDPSYGLYPTLAAIAGADCTQVPVTEKWTIDFPALRTVAEGAEGRPAALTVITNPNAPTGLSEDRRALLEFARANPGLTLVDEAYIEFGGESVADVAGTEEYARLMTCNTMSKSYALAGMRLGWLVAQPALIEQFDKVRDSYNLSRIAQAAGLAVLEEEDEMRQRTQEVIRLRQALIAELDRLGFVTLKSSANFVFTSPPAHAGPAGQLFARLEEQGIIVRHFDRDRLAAYLRITVGTADQMQRLTAALEELTRVT